MLQTVSKTTNKTTWTKLAEEVTAFVVNIQGTGQVLIHVTDASTPPAAGDNIGHLIARGLANVPMVCAMGGLPAGNVVWGKSMADNNEDVTVTSW